MECKLCKSNLCTNLQKEVRGSKSAEVYYCDNCDFAFLDNIDIDPSFYEYEFDTFMAERAGDKSWENSKEHFSQRMKDARVRVSLLKQWIDFDSINSILELGSSSGFLLKAIEEEFPNIKLCGVEPSEKHQKYAKNIGLDIYSDLDSLVEEKFDLIISYFVLEHILEPQVWIKELSKKASNGAFFIAIVPNLNEALVKKYCDEHYDKFIWQLPHVSYFSDKSLKLLLDNEFVNTKIYHLQRYTLSNHLNWLSGIKPKKSIEYSHITKEIDSAYKKSLEENGIGDTLVGVSKIVF